MIARRVLSLYFGMKWKMRSAAKLFGWKRHEDPAEGWRYDQARFLRCTRTRRAVDWPFQTIETQEMSHAHFQAQLIKNYHCIEKAMALRSPQPAFGQKSGVIDRCMRDYESYTDQFGCDAVTRTTYDVLLEYRNRFGKGYPPLEAFLERHRHTRENGITTGGTELMKAEELFAVMEKNMDGFFRTRHSIRDYSPIPVPKDSILKAIELALAGTPSVCNRQPARVHVFSSPQEKADLLRLQNGNAGFGSSASHILMVTTSLEAFLDPDERNQCWISGGMFAQSLVYALHAMRVATCVLNWDTEPCTDRDMHRLAAIPDTEVIVMLIAIGHYPPEVRTTRSQRKDVQEIVAFH